MLDQGVRRRIEKLERENARLRAELWEQWEDNHSEHCSNQWPHPDGEICCCPVPPHPADLSLPMRLCGFTLEKGIDAVNFLYDLLEIIGITPKSRGACSRVVSAEKLDIL